jgi:hypothetical protein
MQIIVTTLLVALSVAYLLRYVYRALNRSHDGCEGCDCCAHQGKKQENAPCCHKK